MGDNREETLDCFLCLVFHLDEENIRFFLKNENILS